MIDQAVKLIQSGKLVAFPTETVYGLGADATQDLAVAKIFEVKNRPQFNPLIVHFSNLESVYSNVIFNDNAKKLAQKFWPGPLTLVLPRSPHSQISLLVSAGLQTLAVRIPNHPVALDFISSAKVPMAAPSANLSGSLSPTMAVHVKESFGSRIPLILEGGACQVGLESTVMDLTEKIPILLRPGAITREMIEKEIGLIQVSNENSNVPKSPGLLLKHYSPTIPIRINIEEIQHNETLLSFGPHSLKGFVKELNLSLTQNLTEAAANLFSMLHELDQPEFSGIAVMPIPEEGLGIAINDRLKRAAFK